MKPTIAIHQSAEESEQQLIDRAKRSITQCNWTIGECASQWVRKHSKGRTDADFADLIGMERTQVAQRRAVFEKYEKCDLNHTFGDGGSVNLRDVLSGTHFYVAMNWDDAKTCLSWAADMEATVAEMKAWRRATHGEDLTEDSDPAPETLEPIVAAVKPVTAARPPEEHETDTKSPRPPSNLVSTPREAKPVEQPKRERAISIADAEPAVDEDMVTRLVQLLRQAREQVEKMLGHAELSVLIAELEDWLKVLNPVKPNRFARPTVEEVAEHCRKRGYDLDAEAFVAFYESKGWKVGGQSMKDWKAATLTWEKRKSQEQRGRPLSVQEQNEKVFDQVFGARTDFNDDEAPY